MACNKKRLRVSLPGALGRKARLQPLTSEPLPSPPAGVRSALSPLRAFPSPFTPWGPGPAHRCANRKRRASARDRCASGCCTGRARGPAGAGAGARPLLPFRASSDFCRAWSRPLVTLRSPGGRVAGEARGPGRREGSGRPYPPPRRPQPQSLGGASPECLCGAPFRAHLSPRPAPHGPRPAPPGAPAPVPRGSARASSPWAPRTPGAHGQGGPEVTSQLWRSVGRLARRAQPAPNASYPCLLVSGKTFVAARPPARPYSVTWA